MTGPPCHVRLLAVPLLPVSVSCWGAASASAAPAFAVPLRRTRPPIAGPECAPPAPGSPSAAASAATAMKRRWTQLNRKLPRPASHSRAALPRRQRKLDLCRGRAVRKCDREGRALAGLARDGHPAVHRLRQLLDDRQP